MTTKIIGTGHYVPERIITNDDLAMIMDTSDEWISERTGIHQSAPEPRICTPKRRCCPAAHRPRPKSVFQNQCCWCLLLPCFPPVDGNRIGYKPRPVSGPKSRGNRRGYTTNYNRAAAAASTKERQFAEPAGYIQ